MKEHLNIYICDDNSDFTNKIKNQISIIIKDKRKCEILTFSNGKELLKTFDSDFPDVVLLDIDMPEMDGFEVASLLQKRKDDV